MSVYATAGASTVPEPVHLSLRRLSVSWFERIVPERPGPFLAVVAAISAAVWLAGLVLAEDRARFLASREWQAQPVYLAVHLVVLRLFVTAYAGGFLAGCGPLVIDPAEAERMARRVLGPAGLAAALVLAAPLALLDVRYLHSTQFESATTAGAGAIGPADWLLVSIWIVEWIANAYVWVVILGFLFASLHAINGHAYRDPVMKVLRERQYRPFLLMSSRGASIVLAFTAVSALYVLYASGGTSDYVGLWATAGLLLVGFVPPWLRLRSRISALVREETVRLGANIESAMEERGAPAQEPPPPRTLESIGEHVQTMFAFQRIEYLDRLHADMGKIEAQAVLLRLLAPVATIAWRLARGG